MLGPKIEIFHVLEIMNFRPPLSLRVSRFPSALIYTNSFKLSVSFVIFTSVLCA